MVVVNILGDKHALHILVQSAEFLELGDFLVTLVRTLGLSFDIIEIVVPLPSAFRLVSEEPLGANITGFNSATVGLTALPETVLTSEGWDARASRDTSSGQQNDLLAVSDGIGCFSCGCVSLNLMVILVSFFVHRGSHVFIFSCLSLIKHCSSTYSI